MSNPHAIALGKLAAGKPKKYTATEINKRTERLILARQAKARSHAQCVKAGKAGAAVRWGKQNKETGGK